MKHKASGFRENKQNNIQTKVTLHVMSWSQIRLNKFKRVKRTYSPP